MADYYTTFSEQLTFKTRQGATWAQKYLEQFNGEIDEDNPKSEELEALADLYELESDYFVLEFQWDISQENKKWGIWMRSEENGNPDHVAQFVQAYLKKFDPQGCFGLSWAATCSKMRTDAFGGGAIFITAETIDWMHTGDWIFKKRQSFNEKKKAS